MTMNEHTPSVRRLTRDLATAAATMTEDEARFLVDAFYISQDDRKRAHNQVRAMKGEPHMVIGWLAEQGEMLEGQIKLALDRYTDARPEGVWMKSVYGIGPVISAGLLAHIDIEQAPTVGHVYSFAGIAGSGQKPWEKNTKRPFNAGLRTLTWKTGQCFMKFSNKPECVYGHIYRKRKDYELARNAPGGYNATAAADMLAKKNFKKDTDAYKAYSQGYLPPAHIDARARRYAVKLFLSHVHCVMHWYRHNKLPSNPYAIDHVDGHSHFVVMPNVELVTGLQEALREKGLI